MLLCGFLTALAAVSHAQETLSLDQAVRSALENHARIQAESAKVTAAKGFVQQAGLRPNPRLFIQSENWNFSGSIPQPLASAFTDQFLYASQVLETAGKRARRMELAQDAQAVAEQDREVVVRGIVARVRFAYWAAVGARRAVNLLQDTQDNFRQTIDYHVAQAREGAIAEGDLLRVRLEGDRVTVAYETAQRELLAANTELLRAMGRQDFPELRLADTLEGAPAPPAVDVEAALNARPEIQRDRKALAEAQANLRLQQALAKPDVEVLAGYKRTAGYNTALWGLQIGLPFSNKNQGAIAAAASQIRGAEAALKATEAEVRAEIQAARQDVEARRLRLAGLMKESLSRSGQSVEIARAAYREGATDLLRLLDAERVNIEIRMLNARLLTEYRQSLVLLRSALGVTE
jgi:cobalt-zinc-cadmium efflux system outer membrane protein